MHLKAYQFVLDSFSVLHTEDDVVFSDLELTDTFELRSVVSADASEPAGGVVTHPQVALLL